MLPFLIMNCVTFINYKLILNFGLMDKLIKLWNTVCVCIVSVLSHIIYSSWNHTKFSKFKNFYHWNLITCYLKVLLWMPWNQIPFFFSFEKPLLLNTTIVFPKSLYWCLPDKLSIKVFFLPISFGLSVRLLAYLLLATTMT